MGITTSNYSGYGLKDRYWSSSVNIYYYGGSGDGTGTGDKDDEGLQDGLNMDVEYDIKGLVLGAYAEWGSNGGNKSFQKWLEENPNVVRALLTNSLDNMATAAVGKKTDEAKDLAALLLASLNEHTGVDGKDGDTIAKALQKYIDSGRISPKSMGTDAQALVYKAAAWPAAPTRVSTASTPAALRHWQTVCTASGRPAARL